MSAVTHLSYEKLVAPVRLARAVGILSSSFLAGYLASCSTINTASREIDGTLFLLVMLSSVSFTYLTTHALRSPKSLYGTELDPHRFIYGYTAAAILACAIIPFTVVFMRLDKPPINQSVVNGIRCGLPLLAAVVATYATVEEYHFRAAWM